MIRRPPRSTQSRSSAASDVYKRQGEIAEMIDRVDVRTLVDFGQDGAERWKIRVDVGDQCVPHQARALGVAESRLCTADKSAFVAFLIRMTPPRQLGVCEHAMPSKKSAAVRTTALCERLRRAHKRAHELSIDLGCEFG